MRFRDPRVLVPSPRQPLSRLVLELAGVAAILAAFVAALAVFG